MWGKSPHFFHEFALGIPPASYRALYDGAPDGILLVDHRGRIVDANPQAVQAFGYSLDELVGESVEILIPGDARERHVGHRQRYLREPLARPMGIGMELTARRKDATEFPVEISLSTVEGETGVLTMATVRDVSQRRRLRDFGASALRAAENVRMEIARDLHDDTAQQLSAHLIRLRLLDRAATAEEREKHLAALREGLHETAESVRRIARGLRPPELADAGLLPALQAHVRLLRESRGLDVALDVSPVEAALDDDGLLVLYRIIQEALTNVARHAQADRTRVTVRKEGASVVAVVQDNGRGFPAQRTLMGGEGLGLMGMQERASMVGGALTLDSAPGDGTTVTVRIPVQIEREVERV